MSNTIDVFKPYFIIVAGSRGFSDAQMLNRVLVEYVTRAHATYPHMNVKLASGMAPGADMMAVTWANANKIPVMPFPAQWDLHGKAAGPIRNREMAEISHELLAFWDGQSRGTKHMIETMQKRNKTVHIIRY